MHFFLSRCYGNVNDVTDGIAQNPPVGVVLVLGK